MYTATGTEFRSLHTYVYAHSSTHTYTIRCIHHPHVLPCAVNIAQHYSTGVQQQRAKEIPQNHNTFVQYIHT